VFLCAFAYVNVSLVKINTLFMKFYGIILNRGNVKVDFVVVVSINAGHTELILL